MKQHKDDNRIPIYQWSRSFFKGVSKEGSYHYTFDNPKFTKLSINIYHTIYIGLLLLVIFFQLKPLFFGASMSEISEMNIIVSILCLYLIVRAVRYNRKFHRDADRIAAEMQKESDGQQEE